MKFTAEHRKKISEANKGQVPWIKGKHHTEETKQKMRESQLGENNSFYGKRHTEETRKKLSLLHKGKNNPMYGKHRIEETKRKIGEGNKGKHHSKETRRKMSEKRRGKKHHMYGKHHSNKTKQKISKSNSGKMPWNLGKPHSDETKKKISEIKREQWSDEEFAKEMFEKIHAQPNKKEIRLNKLLQRKFPNVRKYVDDGQVCISGKIPDFVNISGKKQIIELFGSYWHKLEDELERKKIFSEKGFDLLIIWDYELKDEFSVAEKIREYMGYDDDKIGKMDGIHV